MASGLKRFDDYSGRRQAGFYFTWILCNAIVTGHEPSFMELKVAEGPGRAKRAVYLLQLKHHGVSGNYGLV